MSNNENNSKEKDKEIEKDKKKKFGTLKPLTAVQIISLILPSSPSGAGACY